MNSDFPMTIDLWLRWAIFKGVGWKLVVDVQYLCIQKLTGGEGGIRTPGGLPTTAVFKTARFDRSRTSPLLHFYYS